MAINPRMRDVEAFISVILFEHVSANRMGSSIMKVIL